MRANRLMFLISMGLLLVATCSCGPVGPAGGVIAVVTVVAKILPNGGNGDPPPPPPPVSLMFGPANPVGQRVNYDQTNVTVTQLKLTVNYEDDVDISSVTLTAVGTIDSATDIATVQLYFDDNQNGQIDAPNDVQLDSDQTFSGGTAAFTFPDRTILSGDSECYLAVVDLAGTADHDEYFRVNVAQGSDIVAAATVGSTLLTTGGYCQGGMFPIQGVGQVSVAVGANSPSDGGVAEGESDFVMLQLRTTAGNAEAINLSSVTFTASGTLNHTSDITSVRLYLDADNDGVLDGADPQIESGKTFSGTPPTVSFDITGNSLNAGQSAHWLVVYDLTDPLAANLTLQVRIAVSGDISGTGASTSSPALIVGAPLDGPVMNILKKGSLSVGGVPGSPPDNSDVPFVCEWPILHLEFGAGTNEPVDVTSITLNHSGSATANITTDVAEVRLYHDVNENGRYDSYADVLLSTTSSPADTFTLDSFTLTCTAGAKTYALVQYAMAGEEIAASGRTHQVILDGADVTAQGHLTLGSITVATTGGTITGPTMVVRRNYWVTASDSGLSGRYYHTAVSTGTDIIVWGGQGAGSTYFNDGAIYHPLEDTWENVTTTGAPSERRQHCAAWTGSEMFIWGGYNPANAYLGDGAMYDPATDSWTAITAINAPENRMDAVAVWTGSKVIIWGGYNGSYADTGGVYDPVTDEWTEINSTHIYTPTARRYTDTDWNGSGMIIWGGFSPTYLNDGSIYDPQADTWSEIPTAGAPSGRRDHTVVWCDDRFVVWGGHNGTQHLASGSYFKDGGWTDLILGPSGRSQHTAVWDGVYMTVWGGYDGTGSGQDVMQTGSRYKVNNGNWYATSTTNAPPARRQHAAALCGTGMVIWGGNASKSLYLLINTGGRYLP